MTIEAMKQWLEALEINLVFLRNVKPFKGQEDLASDCVAMTEETITSIDQAIAEAEKEPVAVMQLYTDGWDLIEGIDTDWLETLPFGTTLYTHPQPKSEWVGLTDEEILDLYSQFDWDIVTGWEYERAIESKLKDKNGF